MGDIPLAIYLAILFPNYKLLGSKLYQDDVQSVTLPVHGGDNNGRRYEGKNRVCFYTCSQCCQSLYSLYPFFVVFFFHCTIPYSRNSRLIALLNSTKPATYTSMALTPARELLGADLPACLHACILAAFRAVLLHKLNLTNTVRLSGIPSRQPAYKTLRPSWPLKMNRLFGHSPSLIP